MYRPRGYLYPRNQKNFLNVCQCPYIFLIPLQCPYIYSSIWSFSYRALQYGLGQFDYDKGVLCTLSPRECAEKENQNVFPHISMILSPLGTIFIQIEVRECCKRLFSVNYQSDLFSVLHCYVHSATQGRCFIFPLHRPIHVIIIENVRPQRKWVCK